MPSCVVSDPRSPYRRRRGPLRRLRGNVIDLPAGASASAGEAPAQKGSRRNQEGKRGPEPTGGSTHVNPASPLPSPLKAGKHVEGEPPRFSSTTFAGNSFRLGLRPLPFRRLLGAR